MKTGRLKVEVCTPDGGRLTYNMKAVQPRSLLAVCALLNRISTTKREPKIVDTILKKLRCEKEAAKAVAVAKS